MQTWLQNYTPLGHWFPSAVVAAVPLILLFYLLAVRRMFAPLAAASAAGAAVVIAVALVGMPPQLAVISFLYGGAFGLLPIAWVVFAAIFVYQVSLESGQFEVVKASITNLTPDRRLQALLIAFAFGAIMEGAAGFGAPVAICAALMVGVGFKPFQAAVLCLMANTSPVAWGAVGVPVITLAGVTGLPLNDLSAMCARVLAITAIFIPLWMIRLMVGWKDTLEVAPAALVAGISFGLGVFVWGNYVDPYLINVAAGSFCLVVTTLFLKVWKPRNIWRLDEDKGTQATQVHYTAGQVFRGWLPFLILGVFVMAWGWPSVKTALDAVNIGGIKSIYNIPVPLLDKAVVRTPPAVATEAPQAAIYAFNWLSTTGTGVFIAGILACLVAGFSAPRAYQTFLRTCKFMKVPAMAIFCMLGLGYVIRYSGLDAILGLAFTRTGALYPFFATFLGWIGVMITGSDASANALFGSLQRITAEKLGLDPVLMAAANTTGGVAGKLIAFQSIVVATTATKSTGNEASILRAVLPQSIALLVIIGIIVMIIQYVFPGWVPHNLQFGA
jgi:lactate permease